MDKEGAVTSRATMWRRLTLIGGTVLATVALGAGPLMAQDSGTGSYKAAPTPARVAPPTTTVARTSAGRVPTAAPLPPPTRPRAVPPARASSVLVVQVNSDALKGQAVGSCAWGDLNCVMEVLSRCPGKGLISEDGQVFNGGKYTVACPPEGATGFRSVCIYVV